MNFYAPSIAEQDLARLHAENLVLDAIAERLRAAHDWMRWGLDCTIEDRPHNGLLLQRKDIS